tara:strand:+ start:1493 stop:1771 length:279 start_codon:yes stop_codon:yes gene_type:complete
VTTKAIKPITAAKTNSPKASKVNKQKIIDAIVNLEKIVDSLFQQQFLLDNAFREYLVFKNDGVMFQEHLDKVEEAKKEKSLEDGEPIKSESE